MGLFDGLAPQLAAYSAGQQINANLAATQADTQLKMQSLANGQLEQQQKQQLFQQKQAQQAAVQQMMEGWATQDQTQQATKVASGTSPDIQQEQRIQQEADHYRQLSKAYLVSDPGTSETYSKMADASEGRLGTLRTQNMNIANKKTAQTASFAGSVLDGSTTPDQAFAWAKDNLGVEEAMKIPTDPAQAKLYWKAKQDQGLSAAEQLQQQLAAQTAKDKKEAAEQASRDRADALAERKQEAAARLELLRSTKEAAAESKAEATATRIENTHFQQTEKMVTSLQRTAKPFLDDKQRLDQVGGLLQQGTAEGDQQAHQALTSLLGNFKGRATSQFYKDNANFGSLAGRLSGALAHGFSGQYKDDDRQGLLAMVNQLRSNVVEPTLNNLELQQKARAKGYGLDPDQIQIEGDFVRSDTPANLGKATGKTYSPAPAPTPAPQTPWQHATDPGHAAPAAAPKAPAAAPTSFAEGQTATGPDGHRIVFRSGKWVNQ